MKSHSGAKKRHSFVSDDLRRYPVPQGDLADKVEEVYAVNQFEGKGNPDFVINP